MLLFAGTEEYFETFRNAPRERQLAGLAAVDKWSQEHMAAGRVLEGHRLRPASTATTVRIPHPLGSTNGAKALVTDGPFIDAKERIGGYLIIDVPDLDAAIALAKSWPAGGTVEIRPIDEIPPVS